MHPTKQSILINAEKLFYEHGIANVRLQQIADKTGISVGNLAYHFNNKEAIVEAVYKNTMEELSNILVVSNIHSGLGSLNSKFSKLYKFMEANIFYYTNFWEIKRNYPVINKKIQNINKKILFKLKVRLNENIKDGLIKKEEFKGSNDMLAKALLLCINSWIPQQLLNDKLIKKELFKKALWNLIFPHFTEKGKRQFFSLNHSLEEI